MHFWEFNVNTLDAWIYVGIITIIFLLSNTLRRKVGLIRKSLLPTAVIGGLLVLILKSIGLFDNLFNVEEMNGFMEAVTYHTLGFGVIALSLKTNKREKNKHSNKQIFSAGLVTVNTYLIQAIIGTAIVLLLTSTFMKDLFPAAGFLLPLGYGQGSGQAGTFGKNFEEYYGFSGGTSFGLTIAAIGFLVACLIGVTHIFIMRKRGIIKGTGKVEFTTVEVATSPNEVPVTEAVDRLTIQAGLIMFVYFLTFLVIYGVHQVDLGKFGENTLKPLITGFNFLIGSIFAIILKVVFSKLREKNIMTRDYPNDYLLNRISGFMFDIMIIAGIAAIKIEVLKGLIVPLVIICVIGAIVTYFYVRKVSYLLFPGYEEAAFVSLFGMLTGTTSTGMILLREVDPNFETPASANLVYQSFYAIAFGFPLFALLGVAPNGLKETIISFVIIIIMFIAFNILMLRDRIFKKKAKE